LGAYESGPRLNTTKDRLPSTGMRLLCLVLEFLSVPFFFVFFVGSPSRSRKRSRKAKRQLCLLVEDDPVISMTMRKGVMRKLCCDCMVAKNLEEAHSVYQKYCLTWSQVTGIYQKGKLQKIS